jgi:hypothetical protein
MELARMLIEIGADLDVRGMFFYFAWSIPVLSST